MPTSIFRDDVRRLMTEGAHLIDVLPSGEYADQHLPGAVNIPLKALNADTTGRLRKDLPVVVYCYDYP